MMLSDLGVAFVYNRNMPAVYYSGHTETVTDWNTTVFWFRLITSVAYSIVISVVYLVKYADPLNTFFLLMLAPLLTITSFSISKFTAQSDFTVYRRINSFQAFTKLIVLPLVFWFGLAGWFVSQAVSGMLTMVAIKGRIFPTKYYINIKIIKDHFIEGLLLVFTTFMWSQLLSSGRLFASFYYPNSIIAQYGLLNTGYQILASLIVAAFLPVTVTVFKLIETNEDQAIEHIFNAILKTIPVVFILAVVVSEISPFIMAKLFKKYAIDSIITKSLIFSIITYPIVVTIGNLFIAKKKTLYYVSLTSVFFVINWCLVLLLERAYQYQAASIAQCISIFSYTLFELLLAFYLFGSIIKHKLIKIISIYGELLLMISIYAGFKKLILG